MKTIFRKPRSERGAATVEFFFAVPFVVALGMAGLEFAHMAAMQSSVDDAAHAVARAASAGDVSQAEALQTALDATGSLPEDATEVSVSVGEEESQGYTHRLPSSTGSGWKDRASSTARRAVTADVSSSYAPTTPVGSAISAALGTPGKIGFKSSATEWRDATVEGGASSW